MKLSCKELDELQPGFVQLRAPVLDDRIMILNFNPSIPRLPLDVTIEGEAGSMPEAIEVKRNDGATVQAWHETFKGVAFVTPVSVFILSREASGLWVPGEDIQVADEYAYSGFVYHLGSFVLSKQRKMITEKVMADLELS